MITEDRIREALHSAVAHVEVDEEVASQRAVARGRAAADPPRAAQEHCIRRRRGDGGRGAHVAAVRTCRHEPVGRVNRATTRVGAHDRPLCVRRSGAGCFGAPQLWIDAAAALASARGNVAGALEWSDFATSASQVPGPTTRLSFATDTQGRYRVDDPSLSSFATADGSTLQIDTKHKQVNVDIPLPGSPVPMLELPGRSHARSGRVDRERPSATTPTWASCTAAAASSTATRCCGSR